MAFVADVSSTSFDPHATPFASPSLPSSCASPSNLAFPPFLHPTDQVPSGLRLSQQRAVAEQVLRRQQCGSPGSALPPIDDTEEWNGIEWFRMECNGLDWIRMERFKPLTLNLKLLGVLGGHPGRHIVLEGASTGVTGGFLRGHQGCPKGSP